MLYTLYATNTYYDLELFHTKDLDEAMKMGAVFGRLRKNIVVWNHSYHEPQPEKMERVELYAYGGGATEGLLGRFDEQGDFIEAEETEG